MRLQPWFRLWVGVTNKLLERLFCKGVSLASSYTNRRSQGTTLHLPHPVLQMLGHVLARSRTEVWHVQHLGDSPVATLIESPVYLLRHITARPPGQPVELRSIATLSGHRHCTDGNPWTTTQLLCYSL